MTSLWVAIGSIITALCALIGVMWTASSARRANRETQEAAPYKELSADVTRLYGEVEALWSRVRGLTTDLDIVVDALWEQDQHPGSPIARRALAVMHRRRAERIEDPPDDGQPADPTNT